MGNEINNLIIELNQQLDNIILQNTDTIKQSEVAINSILFYLKKIKKIVKNNNFQTKEDEIHFFKNTKPSLVSNLIYYNKIYKIETKTPQGGIKIQKKYFENELYKLKKFHLNNIEFIKYYRSENTIFDEIYFLRGKINIKNFIANYYFETDSKFSTSHDFKVAKIKANLLLESYIANKIKLLHNKKDLETSQPVHNSKLAWTESKVALIELIYALHSKGVFNNGNSDLKNIVFFFESMFQIDLGQYRRVFLEIRSRKSERIKFIDSLKNALENKIDRSEDRF